MIVLFWLSLSGAFAIETLEVKNTRGESPLLWEIQSPQPVSDLFNKTTNVTYSSGGNRSRFFQIRGVGERSQFDNVNQSPVGFFYEQIDLSEESFAVQANQHKSLRVSKSSQSVEYGSKAMGGIVMMESCPKEQCRKNSLSLGTGHFETYYGEIHLNTNWSEEFSTQMGFHQRKSQGFQENSYLKMKTADQKESYLELHNTYYAGVNVETHHIFAAHNNGYDFFNHNNDFISDSDRPGREENRINGHSVIVEKSWGGSSLQSISSYTASHIEQSYDEDWGNNAYWNTVNGWNQDYDYSSHNKFIKKKWHQKLVLNNENSFVGLHYYGSKGRIDNTAYKKGSQRSHIEAENQLHSYAIYGGGTYEQEAWATRHSLRIENQQRKLSGSSLDASAQDFLWALESQWDFFISNDQKIYSNLSKAFRGGGFNLETSLNPSRRSFKNEDLYLFELGYSQQSTKNIKDIKLFYMFRENMQLRTSFQDDPMDPSSFDFYTDNVTTAQVYGIELDYGLKYGRWGYRLSLAGLVSAFGDYRYQAVDLTQRNIPYAPGYSFHNELSFAWSKSLGSTLSYYGKDSFYYSNSHSQKSKAYQLWDASLKYTKGSLELLLMIKNIFNKAYSLRGFYFANEPPQWDERLYTQQESPRSAWIQLSYNF